MLKGSHLTKLANLIAVAASASSLSAVYATQYSGKPPLGKFGAYLTAVAPATKYAGYTGITLGALARWAGGNKDLSRFAQASGTAALHIAGIGMQEKPTRKGAPKRTVRFYFHNVLYENSDGGMQIAAQIAAVDPDVVVLVEAQKQATLNILPSLENYLYQHMWKTDTPDGYFIASRIPLENVHVPATTSTRPPLLFRLSLPGCASLQVAAVHLNAPDTGPKVQLWAREHHLLSGILNRIPRGLPLLVLGDFNAGRQHAPFRRLLRETRLYDVIGSSPTWPVGRKRIPTIFGLDHALVRGTGVYAGAGVLPAAGSDHHGLVINVSLTEQ